MKIISAFFILISLSAFAIEKNWSYVDSPTTVGPKNWGALPGDELCATGTRQTPIDLKSSVPATNLASPLEFHYQPSPVSLTNNGHTIQADVRPGSALIVDGKTFQLAQFHFHAHSEHSVDGKFSPLELHLVHLNAEGKPAAVVGIFIRVGKHNSVLDSIFPNFPKKSGEKKELTAQFDPSTLLPSDRSYFKYPGSLTTPPCSEGIQWLVLKTPVQADKGQIAAFTRLPGFNHTARPIQPVGERILERSK
jgi:carbonic anhydrase